MENFLQNQGHEKKQPKESLATEKAVNEIMQEFKKDFPDHKLSFTGVQLGYGYGDSYLFNIDTPNSKACEATFSAENLVYSSVKDAFVDKMKQFGEEVVEN